jgi:hypothetical protein
MRASSCQSRETGSVDTANEYHEWNVPFSKETATLQNTHGCEEQGINNRQE